MKVKFSFNLIHFSAVLITAGLFISLVLFTQNLMRSTRIKAFVMQIQQYDIAVGNFAANYNWQIPGDSNMMLPQGNNNQRGLDPVDDKSCKLATCDESMGFWKHLSDAGVSKEKYDNNYSGTYYHVGRNIPKTALGKSVLVGGDYRDADSGNLGAMGFLYFVTALFEDDLPSGKDVMDIEKKMDDDNVSKGKVRSRGLRPFPPCTVREEHCYIHIQVTPEESR